MDAESESKAIAFNKALQDGADKLAETAITSVTKAEFTDSPECRAMIASYRDQGFRVMTHRNSLYVLPA